jgi:hypothetical protein
LDFLQRLEQQLVYERNATLYFCSSEFCTFIATVGLGWASHGIGQEGPYEVFVASQLPDSFAPIAFLFAITLFMFPLHSSIDKPAHFTKSLIGGFTMAYLFNGTFGTLGYAIFGASVQVHWATDELTFGTS